MIDIPKYKVAFIYLGQEHDEYTEINTSLKLRGIEGLLVHLDQINDINWLEYDLISVQMCRGFHQDSRFLDKIEALQEIINALPGKYIPIFNPPNLIRAAIDKGIYLHLLEVQGIKTVPTRWVKRGERITIAQILEENGWDDVVLKPTISSRSWRTYRISRIDGEYTVSEPMPIYFENKLQSQKEVLSFRIIVSDQMPKHEQVFQELVNAHDVCVQKFMPNILTEGETSFVFIDGSFSHAVQKTVGYNAWIAHEFYGGTNRYKEASSTEEIWAQNIYNKISQKYGNLLYSRIDAISEQSGELKLLECELVAPRLFLREGKSVEKYVDAIINKILSL